MKPRMLIALAVLLSIASPAAATVAPEFDFDNQTRLVAGITVSGHLMLSLGLEHLANEDFSIRGELLWALAKKRAFGVQTNLTYRWRMDGSTSSSTSPRGRGGVLSAGYMRLYAREQDGRWRNLPLWHLSPGLRWGLDDGSELDIELPIGWIHEDRRVLPLGLQARWRPSDPLID